LNEAFGDETCNASASELAAFCLRRPDLVQINQQYVDHARLQDTKRAGLQSAPSRLLEVA